MAGLGKKTFAQEEILRAADVNGYLMDQTVMRFADDTARSSAIGTATEGMVSYLDSTDAVEVFDGSVWKSVGGATSPNYIINGAFDVWQRGTSIVTTTDTAVYTADRWMVYGGTSFNTVSRQLTADTTNLPDIQYATRVQRNSGNTGTIDLRIIYSQETPLSRPLSGKTATLSFWARAGANFSSASSTLVSAVSTGTGTDQNLITTGFTGQVNQAQTNTLTTTWQRFTQVVTIGSTVTQYGLRFAYTPVGTAGANDWFEVTGVQLEAGSVATPFKRHAPSLQGELAACQRYFTAITGDGNTNGAAPMTSFGTGFSTTNAQFALPLPVSMRVAPSVTFSSGTHFRVYDTVNAATTTTGAALASAGSQPNQVLISASVSSGLVQYRPYYLIPAASTVASIFISAEL
jgi:hypothetical protein